MRKMRNLNITISNRQNKLKLPENIPALLDAVLSRGFKRVFKDQAKANEDILFSLHVHFVSSSEIRSLNANLRGVDEATDVLSFPMFSFVKGELLQPFEEYDFEEPLSEEKVIMLGDIVLSLEKASEQARAYNHSLVREVSFLALHGFLHIMGFDHMEEADEKEMIALQEEILEECHIRRESVAEVDGEIFSKTEQIRQAGFVSIIGRPNMGKSTLLNQINGSELAITSYKPQTTRNLIRAVIRDEDKQIVFIDSPGIHRGDRALDQYMSRAISSAMSLADILLLMIDARFSPKVEAIERSVAKFAKDRDKPLFLILNKVDMVKKEHLLPLIDVFHKELAPAEIVPLSALTGEGVDLLIQLIGQYLPEREALFTDDDYTNQTERSLAGELIRQQILYQMEEEIPHGTAVVIESFEDVLADRERAFDNRESILIEATIIIERSNHKGMILGKGGHRIKEIRKRSQKKMTEMFGVPVQLELFVQVKDKWRRRPQILQEIGYDISDLDLD